jgi:hypothetical protein
MATIHGSRLHTTANFLRRYGWVVDVDYPGFLSMRHPDHHPAVFCAGVANGPWAIDVYADQGAIECGAYGQTIITDADVDTDPGGVAVAIHCAINRPGAYGGGR